MNPLSDFVSREWMVASSRNLLLRGDEQVRLEPRVMDVLVQLAERAGEVVSKDELVERVWQGRHVTDDVLTVTICALRRALRDDARQPSYIETVSRRGYRWIAPITRPQDAMRSSPQERRMAWGKEATAAIALALLTVGALWIAPFSRREHVATAEAHEAYLKGRFFLDQRAIEGCRQALQQFERAVSLDPEDPAAQAGLADTYSTMSDFGVASPAEMRPRAMRAAARAQELGPRSAEGHAAMGRAQFLFDWDFAGAERSLQRAIALNPDFMPAHQAMAWLKSAQGHHDQAVAAARRALQLDPVNTARYNELAWVLALGGRYQEALREVERALPLNPRSFDTLRMKGWTYELAGQPDAAFAAYREAMRIAGAPDTALERADAVYRAEGLAGYYRDWLDRLRRSGALPSSGALRARLYVRALDFDHAIESLEQAYQKRESALAWVHVDPSLQPLRFDQRFQKIAAQIGRP